jgi:hypothetical protein
MNGRQIFALCQIIRDGAIVSQETCYGIVEVAKFFKSHDIAFWRNSIVTCEMQNNGVLIYTYTEGL